MGSSRGRIRIPIFASLLTANVALLSLAVFSLVALSVREFRDDKRTYVVDFSSQVAESVAEQVSGGIAAQREKLEVLATILLEGGVERQRAALVESMFTHYPEVARFEASIAGKPPVRIYNKTLLSKLGFASNEAYEAKRRAPDRLTDSDLAIVHQPVSSKSLALTISFRRGGAAVQGDVVPRSLMKPFVTPGAVEVFLVDRGGKLVVHEDLVRLAAGMDMSPSPIVRRALETRSPGSMAFVEDGRRYLGAYAPVVSGGLAVVTRVPEDKAYAAGNRLVRKSLFAAAALLAIMSIAAAIVARRFAGPLTRMVKATERIGQGDFHVNVTDNRRNEIGDLARSINQMSSELLAREERLKQAQEALIASEKMAAFGTLGAGIAHEVKNPLGGILGCAELAIKKMNAEDPSQRYLQMIEKETRRCIEIVGNLLKFARREKVELQPTDLNQVVADTFKLVNHPLTIKRVEVDLELDPELPQVLANANQLQQVILNLAINAGDAMPNGGKVFLRTTKRQAGGGKREIVVEVKDTGTGIPAEIKNRIFDPFFTTKEPGKGTGLGLSVSYGIVKDHGGVMSVDSVVGKGTTFSVILPEVTAAVPKAEPRAEAR